MRRIVASLLPLFFFVALMAPSRFLSESAHAIDKDRKHQQIVCSPFGKDIKYASWQSMVSKRGHMPTGVATGNVDARRPKLNREVVNTVGMKFVYISPGTFLMGSPRDEPGRDKDEKQHRVTLNKGFYIQTTEVTQGQWKAVMGYNPSNFKDCGGDCPVEQVSWNEAQGFIRKLNKLEGTDRYRLPTEAEWEYACRAGTEAPFAFGRCLYTHQANYNGNYPLKGCIKGIYREKTVKVGSFLPNTWGLYDMHGNVWEWCQDWYGRYPSGHVVDPKGPSSGSRRVLRGGRWSLGARYCRSANRYKEAPGNWVNFLGFRTVCRAQEASLETGDASAAKHGLKARIP